jgi:uncharacterized protein YndB with AHSA1/START domain
VTVTRVERDPDALTLTIVSDFDDPPEAVWQVWADPRRLERWWGPPGFPATVTDHDLTPGGRVAYFMTGPDGQEHHGWWRITAVDAPHALAFDDGFADASGQPDTDSPTTSIEVRLATGKSGGEHGGTTMTIVMRFASLADMEQIIATGTDEGVARAVGQIDALLSASPEP